MPEREPLAAEGGTPVRDSFLPFSRPQLGEDEKREVLEVLESGWITTGPRVAALEGALVDYLGVRHAVCVDSCTAALHVALAQLDLAPGDEVITSPLTFVSTVHAIVHAGGTPVLADVEPDTLNLAPEAAKAALTERTRAVIPVHYGGHPVDMKPLGKLFAGRGVRIIEDAAHAIGARYRGRRAGVLGDAGCFSFYATKNMTTGEGGALVTDDDETAARARLLALHGMSRDAWKRYTDTGSWFYEVLTAGFKYNMTDLEAALGLHQLRRLDAMNARRREIAARYDAGLGDNPALTLPSCRPKVEPVYQLYPIRIDPERLAVDRAGFIEALTAENVGTSVHFIPIHYHPYYRDRLGLGRGSLPAAEAAYESLISLPIYPGMTDEDVDDVVRAVNKVTARHLR